jgi:hypothetical protein
MTQKRVPRRDEVDPKYTWDAQSVFETTEAWEAGVVETGELIEAMSASFRSTPPLRPPSIALTRPPSNAPAGARAFTARQSHRYPS